MKLLPAFMFTTILMGSKCFPNENLRINDLEYFAKQGLNVTVFADIYPDGHQTGVSIIQHGRRVAANGDLRLEISPGQWSPVPAGGEKVVDRKQQMISQVLRYPDDKKNRKGFNPIEYPDLNFTYKVNVKALKGNTFKVSVDLDNALPKEWIGKVGFNFELFPGELFGKSWILDDANGIFTHQPNGPIENFHGEWLAAPLARGKKLVIAPEEERQRIRIEASGRSQLALWDGRSNHNNGWYIVRSLVPEGATVGAIEWLITPHVVNNWQYEPVVQVSQLGYAPDQEKKIIIEQDSNDQKADKVSIYKLGEHGRELVLSKAAKNWGRYLRYHYLTFDFTSIKTPGMYLAEYRGRATHAFKIGHDVYDRHAWQPTLEYYLPVQMCHMRVNEKYRVWHDLCHEDDARMSPVNRNHFDGYLSGPSTLTSYKPMDPVPGLNKGGWHDAGDYDLRIESQMKTVWLLAMMVEEFALDYDATTIDQQKKLVEIHLPDGKSDVLQQIEHGLLSVLGAYKVLGRLYRGIITPTMRQYVLLGDASSQTDNIVYASENKTLTDSPVYSGRSDDRLVFTEKNPNRELLAAAGLAAAARVMQEYNADLAKEALRAAQEVYDNAIEMPKAKMENKVFAAAELALTTKRKKYIHFLVESEQGIVNDIENTGWSMGRALNLIDIDSVKVNIAKAVEAYQEKVNGQSMATPYGVPYEPHIWGAGWGIQKFAVKQYFFNKSWPSLTNRSVVTNALNFVLGVHPGENTISFASGVGAQSATVAYGVNRADWSHIPGGVISGTALIRPDLPELKTWPFFWQQTEYVMGGGATNYMFLVLAADSWFRADPTP